jgi:hypothetical protein
MVDDGLYRCFLLVFYFSKELPAIINTSPNTPKPIVAGLAALPITLPIDTSKNP